MISLLMTARGRLEDSLSVAESTYDLADQPDEVEMLWRIDEDDEILVPHLQKEIPRYPNQKFFVGPRMGGYGSLDVMVNELAKQSNGDYMITWSNDSWFMYPGWDTEYRSNWKPTDIAVIQIARDGPNGFATQFPLITRRVYDILGHYSLNPSIDDYITWVGIRAGCHYYSDVRVKHDHTQGDDVAVEKEIAVPDVQKSFWGLENQKKIAEDAEKLTGDSRDVGDQRLCDFYGWDELKRSMR